MAAAVVKFADAELRRYGFVRGTECKWCASCGFICERMGPKGFKCRPCAAKQAAMVEGECRLHHGTGGDDPSE